MVFACAQEKTNSKWKWTGLAGRTLWDWLQLLVMPATLALGGFWFSQIRKSNEQKAADDNQKEAALQAFIANMSELLLEKQLGESQPEDEVRKIARVRTLTVLRRLDARRKRIALQFLYEADLIDKDKRIIDLLGADLSRADLSRADLSRADLSRADLSRADLSQANLIDSVFREANVIGADLNKANLSGADLREANLRSANLREADLREADLREADLSGEPISTKPTLAKLFSPELTLAKPTSVEPLLLLNNWRRLSHLKAQPYVSDQHTLVGCQISTQVSCHISIDF